MRERKAQPVAPETIEQMAAEEIDALLAQLDPQISSESALVRIDAPGALSAAVVGDTHGDWPSTLDAMEWFLQSPEERAFVGLGDYVDRAPPDCPAGSAVNALYLLSVKASYPDRVFLLQGNHEAARRIPVVPHSLPREMEERWGEDRRRYSRLMGLLERGPIAGYTPSGAFLAHGGVPQHLGSPWTDRFREVDETLMVEVLWSRVPSPTSEESFYPPFDEEALDGFLHATGLRVFLRGHDPGVVGQPLFHDRCLTLHTSRMYARLGGILVAHLPLNRPVFTTEDIEVVRLPGGRPRPRPTKRTTAPPPAARPGSGPSDRPRTAGR